ncbi:O-methyltransferase [Nesterenkonia flava]|uniref:Class I SAM-dependent methyltransferase n=1 Tax=Nesterenkonia flava TaxID=469799 RepID=A0ABU1FT70_9MICC|nr:class I SAM-dependent methyltransferase [Nesterenkonia flava]MDR5711856.1 class I SAM-dependent methyltransferase [Nesterenkonia flava]
MAGTPPSQAAKHSSWTYAEQHAEEDAAIAQARLRADDLGVESVSPGTGAALSALAAGTGARAIVEIGTGAGVSGVFLLRGAPEAVLTSLDPMPDHLAAARQSFRESGIPSSHTRLISGYAQQVLPRLTRGGYDLVFVDAEPEEAEFYAEEGIRLLRRGGTLVINDALDRDRVPKPAVREARTQAMRAVERRLKNDDDLTTALLPTGTGLLLAVKR